MFVILDHQENILEFMDDEDASVEITDTYGGYKALEFECELTDVKRDESLFKQGNKILIDNILFVVNTEVDFDYVKNLIKLDAEELIFELNNCAPFYVGDPAYSRYCSGNTVNITIQFLSRLLNGFYTVVETDLPSLKYNERDITVNGTITKYNLLKQIESELGMYFKRNYRLEGNTIVKEISLLKSENYGVTHDKLLERVTIGENTNKLEYSTDEEKNALGIMPIIKSENTSQVNYTKILREFYNLDINNENIMPYFENYTFSREDVLECAATLYAKIHSYHFVPETINISHEEIFDMEDYEYVEGAEGDETGAHNSEWPENKIYNVDIGMGQFLDLASQLVIDSTINEVPLRIVDCPGITNGNSLNSVFNNEDIFSLANQVQDYISLSGSCPGNISTKYGLVSFQWLIYIICEYLTTSKKVVCKSEEFPQLNKIVPSTVEDNVTYIVDYDNYESMPYFYTQNTNENNNIPTIEPNNTNLNNVIDIEKYISECYPILKVKKTTSASQIYVKIYTQGIADKEQKSFIVNFKEPNKIQDNSEITIDFNKQTINLMKYVETTVTKEVEVTKEAQNTGVITATGKNTCGCCGYPKMPYKNYTRTYEDYCPNCGRRGTLVFGPKGIVDGEITCGNTGPACKSGGEKNGVKLAKGSIKGCDADYCVQCGGDKWGSGKCARVKLTPAEASTTTTEKQTITETTGEYKEITASNNDTEGDNKESLANIITEQSSFEAFHGDVSIELVGCTFVSLKEDNCKLYTLAPFPYIKRAGEQFIFAPVTNASFNYTHMSNENPKLTPFETTEQSVEEVLIGCWKKLNGSGDNTKWLDKAEDITVDLTEENIELEAGDFVYIKLPDSLVFKAQVTEKKYNPKIRADSSLKIGNISRESIL